MLPQTFSWDSDGVTIALCICIAVIIFLVLSWLSNKFLPKKKYRPAQEYIQVPGKLIRIERKSGYFEKSDSPLPHRFIFRFTTLGNDVIEGESVPRFFHTLGLVEGNKVKVFYHPKNPYDFFVE